MQIELDLRDAIENDEFYLEFQPKVSVATLDCSGVEALLRWVHSTRGNVPPTQFTPIAERSGLMLKLGDIVLEKALRQSREWSDAGLSSSMAINVSPVQFDDPMFVDKVRTALAAARVDASMIELEVTESLVMSDSEFN